MEEETSDSEQSRIPCAGRGGENRKSFLQAPKISTRPKSAPAPTTCAPSDAPSDVSSTITVGDRVTIAGIKTGTVRYIGATQFAPGDWCGLELDEPEGKHDGQVNGVRYFNCLPAHGVFAPSAKVELSPSPSECVLGQTFIQENVPEKDKHKSRLAQPRPVSHNSTFLLDSPPSRESSQNRESPSRTLSGSPPESKTPRPTHLPQRTISCPGTVVVKRKKLDTGTDLNSTYSMQHNITTNLNETYALDGNGSGGEDDEYKLPDAVTPSRSIAQAALRLAYDLEGSNPDGGSPTELPFELPGEHLDPMSASQISIASSLGILDDVATRDIDLLTESFMNNHGQDNIFYDMTESLQILDDHQLEDINLLDCIKLRGMSKTEIRKGEDFIELIERDLDRELEGISTPVSGSTMSGKDEDMSSSPEPDLLPSERPDNIPAIPKTLDMTFELGPQQTSTPLSPVQKVAGEKMASPDHSRKLNPHELCKELHGLQNANFGENPSVQRVTDEQPVVVMRRGRKSNGGKKPGEETSPEFPKRMRTSAELDDYDVDLEKRMSASFELAKNVVEQYANLRSGAAAELNQKPSHADGGDAVVPEVDIEVDVEEEEEEDEEVEESSQESSIDDLEVMGTNVVTIYAAPLSNPPKDTGEDLGAGIHDDHLLRDLEAGHVRTERPTSMVSTCSVDTGIMADMPPAVSRAPSLSATDLTDRNERPSSIVSTTSTDTGYQPDTEFDVSGEQPTLTANTPQDDSATLCVTLSSTHRQDTPPGARNLSVVREDEVTDQSMLSMMEDSDHATLDAENDKCDMDEAAAVEEGSGTESQLEDGAEGDNELDSHDSDTEAIMLAEGQSFIPEEQMSSSSGTEQVMDTTPTQDNRIVEGENDNNGNVQHVLTSVTDIVIPLTEVVSLSTDVVMSVDVVMTEEVAVLLSEDITMTSDPEPSKDGESVKNVNKFRKRDSEKDKGTEKHEGKESKPTPTRKSPALKSPRKPESPKKVTVKEKEEKPVVKKRLSIKPPQASRLKAPGSIVLSNDNQTVADNKSKLLKNALNKKKADEKPSRGSGVSPARSPASSPREKKLSKANLHDLSSLAGNIDHPQTIEVRPVIADGGGSGGDDSARKPTKHLPPKSKWGNIMTQIETSKDHKPKAKVGVRSKLDFNKLPVPSGKASETTGGKSNGARPKSQLPNRRMTIAGTGLQRPGSQQSVNSDEVGPASSSKTSSRPNSGQTKPGNKMASTLRKPDRSSSFGSDSQVSQSSRGGAAGGAPSSTPMAARSGLAGVKRKSLVETNTNRSSKLKEPRRASVAVPPGAGRSIMPPPRSTGRPTSAGPSATSTPAPKKQPPSNQKTKSRRVSQQQRQASPQPSPHASLQPSPHSSPQPCTQALLQPLQPDVVTSGLNVGLQQEVCRLGALCESRTKELKQVTMQLRHMSVSCEAMAVMSKYLTEDLHAFEFPRVSRELAATQQQQKQAAARLEELTHQRSVLIDEIQNLKTEHAAETECLSSKHQRALKELEIRMNQEKEEQVQKVIDQHSKEVLTLNSYHERSLRDLKSEQERNVTSLKTEQEEARKHLSRKQEKHIIELTHKHQTHLDEMSIRFEGIKVTLSEKVELLRCECEDLRRREQMYVESFQRDMEMRVQQAIAPYKHLSHEIESLRTVIELRNDELHQLRRHNMELGKELEKLPPAQEQVRTLQQKIENLEAIISIKVDYEKQMTEKHESLKRKYEKETKAKLRLSMDNDELAWRLNQSDRSSPDIMMRSLSHSPTNDSHTPESCRLRSPQPPMSPRSPDPSNGCATPRSPVSKSTPKSSLKRSGTYDLLDQEFDEAERTAS